MNVASLITGNLSCELRGRLRRLFEMYRHNDALPAPALRNAISNREHWRGWIADHAQCRRADEQVRDVMSRVRRHDDEVRSFASRGIADRGAGIGSLLHNQPRRHIRV